MKPSRIILIAVMAVALAWLGIRFFSGNEDTWICSNGQWVKHGNPSASQPTTGCTNGNQNATTSTTNADSIYRATLADLGAADLTAAQQTALRTQATDWSGYSVSTHELGMHDCGASANATKLATINAGSKRERIINTSFHVYLTPNPYHWSTADATAFGNDQTVICGVGATYPFWADADHVLWRTACSSGVMPTAGDPNYQTFVECVQATHVLDQQFGTAE